MKVLVSAKSPGKNPFTVLCYICGKEYGSKSIVIHEKTCLESWELRNEATPVHLRRPRPVKPSLTISGPTPADSTPAAGSQKSAIEAYNEAASLQWQESSLIPCDICNRRFTATALEHHQRACKNGGYFDRHRPPTRGTVDKTHQKRQDELPVSNRGPADKPGRECAHP
ncbi:hypothetical protein HDV03_005491 [Kappamyces sp. JEL0829]|nr:hypothetical protein HDV03_005491 [Kappamyces sp. JEL0829]